MILSHDEFHESPESGDTILISCARPARLRASVEEIGLCPQIPARAAPRASRAGVGPSRVFPPASTRGQSLAEFAIVLPFLLLMLGTLADFGFYIFDYLGTHAGVRDAAAAAMLGKGTAGQKPALLYTAQDLKNIIKRSHGPIQQIADAEIAIEYCCTSAQGSVKTSDFAQATRPDSQWGNANGSSGFDAADDFVGVEIRVMHNHKFLLPINWAKGGGINIGSSAKIFMVQYAP